MSDSAGKSNFEKPNAKYLSLISNRDRVGTTGTHSWSILDIHPRFEFFFMIILELMG